MTNIAVLGFGVVGSGTVELIYQNYNNIKSKIKDDIQVKYILDRRTFPDSPYNDRITTDFEEIISDESVSVVIEVMGGVEPAYTFVKKALESGKSVVTSNKALVAAKGYELLTIAKEKGVNFLFEASVGGGIPVLRPMISCFTADNIKSVSGILNGTTNFILSKMAKENMSFSDALALAQELGYAEADPTDDIQGNDAARKIAILASLAFGKHIYPEFVKTYGITEISKEDVEYAQAMDCAIKLIGRASILDSGKVKIMVSPAIVSKTSQLASIEEVFNGVMVQGEFVGDVLFYGQGAGKIATASAVVCDIMEAITAQNTIESLTWLQGDNTVVEDFDNYAVSAFVRIDKTVEEDFIKIFPQAKKITLDNNRDCGYTIEGITEGFLEKSLKEITVLSIVRIINY